MPTDFVAGDSAIAGATSFLFVPATRPERFAKAFASDAGAVILDLEDAVAPEHKDAARAQLLQGIRGLPSEQLRRTLIRINAVDSPWHLDDAQVARAAVDLGLAGIVLPKADSGDCLQILARMLGARAAVVPLIESLRGLDAVDAIAVAPQVTRLAFGHLDFQQDIGLLCDAQETELTSVRLALVMAARRAGLPPPVDGVTTDTRDAKQLLADAHRARRLGFGGKLCIHPAQIEHVHAAFMPSPSEVEWARRVVAQADSGQALFQLDGRMVDAPVIALARRAMARGGPPSRGPA